MGHLYQRGSTFVRYVDAPSIRYTVTGWAEAAAYRDPRGEDPEQQPARPSSWGCFDELRADGRVAACASLGCRTAAGPNDVAVAPRAVHAVGEHTLRSAQGEVMAW